MYSVRDERDQSRQASNIYLLTQVEGLAAPDGADVDLWLGCPRLNILEQISLLLMYGPGRWTAELAGGYECQLFR